MTGLNFERGKKTVFLLCLKYDRLLQLQSEGMDGDASLYYAEKAIAITRFCSEMRSRNNLQRSRSLFLDNF